jgi:hypothetical protein
MLAELRQAGFNAATQHYIKKNATFDDIKVKLQHKEDFVGYTC